MNDLKRMRMTCLPYKDGRTVFAKDFSTYQAFLDWMETAGSHYEKNGERFPIIKAPHIIQGHIDHDEYNNRHKIVSVFSCGECEEELMDDQLSHCPYCRSMDMKLIEEEKPECDL